ncbi:dienelactone hydrolase family protein [Photobacterium galatheae]|uniref:Dienelactone hydrolase n=1 Tax=Photobacterium galatheae TaxID=1654360 RepID=A0A066RW31_9GAMM|nr:dienelactone hydrolase family protein [Photobacterium galatheae]KDM93301.1 dienelactone hydrolase [Photobacterium galatheae]MCM0150425.1 dienelactone hydrolase family protein [Photobacterium galatheae]
MKVVVLLSGVLVSVQVVANEGKAIHYQVNGADYEGYYIAPKKDAPLVLMVHDWDGLTDYEKKRAQMLAEKGYAVFAVDMFGAGIRPAKVEDRRKLTGALYQDRNKMRSLMQGALAAAKQAGGNTSDAVAMGYCFGGTVVLEFARSGADLKGFVTFHGGLATPEGQNYSQTKGNILVFHGAADTSVTMDDFVTLNQTLEAAEIPNEMVVYSGAPHAFTVFGSERYREDADRKSWQRFLAYLSEAL